MLLREMRDSSMESSIYYSIFIGVVSLIFCILIFWLIKEEFNAIQKNNDRLEKLLKETIDTNSSLREKIKVMEKENNNLREKIKVIVGITK